jgi:hypothetical protein
VNGGMNPHKALRQIMNLNVVIPINSTGASLNIKYPNPTSRGVQRDIDNVNNFAKAKRESSKQATPTAP